MPRDAAQCHANGLRETVTGRRFFVMRAFRSHGEPNGDKVRVSCLVIRKKPEGRVDVVWGSLDSERRADGKSIVSLAVLMLIRPGRKKKD